jgi:hypothetical protein
VAAKKADKGVIIMAEWRYNKPLTNEAVIAETEAVLGYKFPDFFVMVVKEHNGARPPVGVFDTDKTKERTIKSFLSFNTTDTENVFKASEVVSKMQKEVVPFGIDSFGNYICFNKADNRVVFLDFDTGEVEEIADGFNMFWGIIDPANK